MEWKGGEVGPLFFWLWAIAPQVLAAWYRFMAYITEGELYSKQRSGKAVSERTQPGGSAAAGVSLLGGYRARAACSWGVLPGPMIADVKEWFLAMDRRRGDPLFKGGRKQPKTPQRRIFD